ncbi:DNA uptake protein [Idiomarina seosinensis]|uniref:DNA uptake protein n=2 Tax=Idiomarina seosinensis TaxID=281739 RepID=A0A432ZJE9_9GAMM|nr:DNA uptake protein [Idiomarina seosinensis]
MSVSASPLNLNNSMAAPLPILQQGQTTEQAAPLLNINTATAQQLAAVMIGVGGKRAEQIIALREQLGGFTEFEQLLDVKGIGLKTLEKNQSLIRLD